MKKILAIVLAALMLVSAVACGPKDPEGSNEPVVYVDPYKDIENYDEKSLAIYNDVLGEFQKAYDAAKAAANVSERYALMAIAEAKLLASGVLLPSSTNGGNYAISRVAPNTVTSALWGNDSYRYHNVLVATEPLTSEHRAEMKAKWAELKGTGEYEDWAADYLTGKGYTLKDTYNIAYSSDPQTWDVLATSKAADSEAIVNTYDGLYEYDCENVLQPALATSYEKGTTTIDGKTYYTYTFKIREGAKWVDSQGREVADVKADDFVAGMQHMMDADGGLGYLVQGLILNADEYIKGDVTDFAQVGVKAVDDTTLVYTLLTDASYFMTMLGYGVFAPMSRTYYESKGGKFGADYDAEAEDYTYGATPDDIAYCGPYTVTNLTAENTIVFKANPSYWNAENITIKTLTWLFNNGKGDITKGYNDMKAGVIDGASLNASTLELAKQDGWFDKYHYVSATDATTFCSFYNVNRAMYVNFNDETKAVSTKKDDALAQERAVAAMRNANFRLALSFALDRGAYNAQTVGEELKLTSLRNSYTPGNFVYLEEAVTIKMNGADKTYAAGTYYGQIMQDQLDADGIKIKVWDPAADNGIGSSDGFDGWYSVENAKEYLAKAIEELAAIGIEISAENPIKVDLPYYSGHDAYKNRAVAYQKCFTDAFEGKVVLNLVDCPDSAEWYYAGYYISNGAEANFDIYDVSGWGPDYGDPQTYLDTMLPEYAGYMTMMLGIY